MEPQFHATPTRPQRQPSLHVSRAQASSSPSPNHQSNQNYNNGNGWDQQYPPVPQQQHQQHQQYNDQNQYNDYNQQHNNAYQDNGGYDQQWNQNGNGAAHHTRGDSTGISPVVGYGQNGMRNRNDAGYNSPNQERQLYNGNGHPAPFAQENQARPSYDNSMFDGHQQHQGHQDGFYPASSQTHLVGGGGDDQSIYSKQSGFIPNGNQSGWGGHDTIEMKQNNNSFSNVSQMPYNQSTFSGGPPMMPQPQPGPQIAWTGLGAPGAMIASAQGGDMRYRSNNGMSYQETREKIMKRRSIKRVELQNGNLVMECPVPSSICKQGQSEEFTQLRYQAVTCDPNDFIARKYTLRSWLLGRKTEMAIVLTMYNEDPLLFTRTMNNVIKNIANFQSRTKSKTWGNGDAWKKIVVVIVSDGRKKANKDTLKVLQLMGLYQEGLMKDHVLDKPTQAHVFELSSQVYVKPDGTVEVAPCPVQVVFCLKEQNKKKLNSHRWFFNAFCEQLQPEVTVLIDVGTKPASKAIYDLWKVFDKNKNCGGACGEMRVDTGKACWQLVNPLVAAQNFEYKMSNILDKSLEDMFGFISVLPGAFSAYRYKAVKGAPLTAYFKGEAMHSGAPGVEAGTFTSNMYLAEDRILCFEIVTKKRESWVLRYVRSAKASTDVPDTVGEFIGQRRRWLNGSLFAGIYALAHAGRIWSSGQGFLRKLVMSLQAIYNLASLVFSFTALANFYLAFYFLSKSAVSDPDHDPFGGQGDAILEIFHNLYIAMVVVVLVCSLGNRPQGSKFAYLSCIIIFAIIMGITLYCAGWSVYLALDQAGLLTLKGWNSDNILDLFKTSNFRDIVISLAATYLLYLFSSIAHLDPAHMVTSFVQYLFLTPTYVTILSIYSMANLHDLSWGTKGSTDNATDLGAASGKKVDGKHVVEVHVPTSASDAEELWSHVQRDLATPKKEEKSHRSAEQKQMDHASNFRTNFLLIWVGLNALLIIVFTSTWWLRFVRDSLYGGEGKITGQGAIVNPYTTVLFWSNAGLAAVRALGSFTYALLALFGR